MRQWGWWASSGLVVALAVAALVPTSDLPELPTVAAGERVDAAPVSISLHTAKLSTAIAGSALAPEDGFTFLVVTSTATNGWSRPLRVLDAVLTLRGVDARVDRVVIADSGNIRAILQPDVPATVAFIWQLPIGSVAAGEQLWVRVNEQQLSEGGLLDSSPRWQQPQAVAEVPLEITLGLVRELE